MAADNQSFESLAEARRLFAVVESAKREWETTFDAFEDGIGILARDGTFKRTNTALASMVGLDVRELPGRPCCEVFPHHKDTGCPSRLATGHREVEFEVSMPWRRCYREASFAVPGLESVVTIVTDITSTRLADERIKRLHEEAVAANRELLGSMKRLRETQEKLVASEKLASLATMAAGLAHEVNNPLGFVSSGMSHLRDTIDRMLKFYQAFRSGAPKTDLVDLARTGGLEHVEADVASILTDVGSGLDRIRRIVGAFASFVEQGNVPTERVDLNAIVRDAVAEAESEPGGGGTSIVTGLGPVPPINASVVAVRTVMRHLLENAAFAIGKAARPGRVLVATAEREGKVVLTVQDDGIGMASDVLARALDPFFTTRAPGPHVGLGLTIVQAIVRRHGGDLQIRSEPGKGTIVECSLPLPDPDFPPSEFRPSPLLASRT
ncbi:MAG: hypothetical protein FJ087_18710 [Deltaproteobacteria bacterium]|nr:hypothetical protein [Deltaproteobacteria bacterium]